jgi:hypothetical protein
MSTARLTDRRHLLLGVLAGAGAVVLALGAFVPARALAQGSPWWRLDSTTASAPANLPEAQVLVSASNVGDGDVSASVEHPVLLTDRLPAGVQAVRAHAVQVGSINAPKTLLECSPASASEPASTVTCAFTGTLRPFEQLFLYLTVQVAGSPAGPLQNEVTVQGANTPVTAPLVKPLRISQAPASFGVESYELAPEAQGGAPDTQAGSHPFQLTTTLDFDQSLARYGRHGLPGEYFSQAEGVFPTAPALPRDLHFKLPAGLLADASAVPQCSNVQFTAAVTENTVNLCPSDTVVGVASIVANDPTPLGYQESHFTIPVFNLVPAPGEPARFGIEVQEVPVILRTSLPSGGDYAAQVSVEDVSQAIQLLSSQVTFWGTPGADAHDASRGWECLDGGGWYGGEQPPACPTVSAQPQTALLTLPTSCQTPPATSVSGVSWAGGEGVPEQLIEAGQPNTLYTFPSALTECESLEFDPSITVEPESQSASTPTGLNVGVEMPQPGLLAPEGRAEAALRRTTVRFPPGFELNPSAVVNALEDCSASQFGFLNVFAHPFEGAEEERQTGNETFESPFSAVSPGCPDASKLGTVKIATPLLSRELTGSVYLAAQNTDPFKSPLALYLIAEDPESGVRVKLAGSVVIEPDGQLVSTFQNTPQSALFTALHVHFFGGELSTPPACGPASTTSEFIPWSGEPAATPSSTFQVNTGVGGGACPPTPLSFGPSFKAGPTSPQAGAFSPLVVDIGRPDGQQPLSGISVTLPPGFAAVLSSVTPCPEPPAGTEWSCGEESHIGEVKEYSGLGSEPVQLTGQAYLTAGYDGAPFGLLVRTLAQAGPFDLGWVNVRSRINVNPTTAAVTVTSDPGPRGEAIPTALDGVPVQLKALEVAVNRPDFDFNPTSCEPLSSTAALTGAEGATAALSSPFKAEGCGSLPFHPALEASTEGHASKAAGASLTVKVSSQGLGVANIQKVFLTIPKILPSRLQPTLQHACPDAVFNANPAGCDEDSLIGHATVRTPILKSPLTGPAYVVSHGNAAFPDVEFVLQGEGITLVLDGKTDIKKGVTYSRFESAPDAPFTSFETVLPTGPHSVLAVNTEEAPNYDLCTHKITIPTTITAQDGAVLEQTTKVAVTGCPAVKPTNAQLLAKALKACRKDKKKTKRVACEKAARKRYGPKASKTSKKKKK